MKKQDNTNSKDNNPAIEIPSQQLFYNSYLKRFLEYSDNEATESDFIKIEINRIEKECKNIEDFISRLYISGNIAGHPGNDWKWNGLNINRIILKKNNEYLKWLKTKKKKADDLKLPAPKSFSDWFINAEAYKKAMRLLVEQKLMSFPKLKWEYFGAAHKTKAVSILKKFKQIGYFRNDIKITGDDYVRIMQSWEIDIKNVNTGTMRNAIDKKKVDFITPLD